MNSTASRRCHHQLNSVSVHSPAKGMPFARRITQTQIVFACELSHASLDGTRKRCTVIASCAWNMGKATVSLPKGGANGRRCRLFAPPLGARMNERRVALAAAERRVGLGAPNSEGGGWVALRGWWRTNALSQLAQVSIVPSLNCPKCLFAS